jgi:CubicO group peptidase (beta-lactamase class C family)
MTFDAVEAKFVSYAEADPSYSAQLSVHVGPDRVIDLAIGAMQSDSLIPVYSSSKGATAVVVGLLVERGQLDLDAPARRCCTTASPSGRWPTSSCGGSTAARWPKS